ncbi:hypothetical protein N9W79_00125, partial [bacterium]|nr:hypothetical protein [bacterium]
MKNKNSQCFRSYKAERKTETKISFDIADPFIVDLNKEDFADIISKHADIVFANEEEAKLLYGASPEETAEKI